MERQLLIDEAQGSVATYPPNVDDLLPQARALAKSAGKLPSRNKLMSKLRIGAPKANALRDILAAQNHPEPTPDPPSPTGSETITAPPEPAVPDPADPQATRVADPGPAPSTKRRHAVRPWPLYIIAVPAAVSIWVGWVGLGGLTGFGPVRPLPGIVDEWVINSAITLPIGMEAYAAYALRAWLSPALVPTRARRFAKWSAIGALALGAAGQIAYHLMAAEGMTAAPRPITAAVACLPVAVLGMGAALAHLLTRTEVESS